MEDIVRFNSFYKTIKVLWTIVCAIICVVMFFAFLEHGNVEPILALIATVFVWYVVIFLIKLEEIIVTRFIAMTENVLEITEMLEKKENKE